MSDKKAVVRQLKIHSGAVTRLNKELALYQQEEEDAKRNVEKLTAAGADEAEIRRADNLLKEAAKMPADTKKRMAASVATLKETIIHAQTMDDLKEDESLLKAQEALQTAEL